jgi:urease accessory protein
MKALTGHLRFKAASNTAGETTLVEQSFCAPFHLSKPHWDPDTKVLHAQVVNPTAGILAGDELDLAVEVASGAALLLTTPSASRVFKMEGEQQAWGRQSFRVATGGWLEVFPEPLVPHAGSAYTQETQVEVAKGGGLFLVDQLMPGRLAHGEAWQWRHLVLGLRVEVDGALILRERWEQSGESLASLADFTGTGSNSCFANAILIVPPLAKATGQDWLAAIRQLHRDGVWVGMSALHSSGWSLRIIAPHPVAMRATLEAVRKILKTTFPRLGCGLRRP